MDDLVQLVTDFLNKPDNAMAETCTQIRDTLSSMLETHPHMQRCNDCKVHRDMTGRVMHAVMDHPLSAMCTQEMSEQTGLDYTTAAAMVMFIACLSAVTIAIEVAAEAQVEGGDASQ